MGPGHPGLRFPWFGHRERKGFAMGFFDDASDFIDRGVSAAKGAVSNVACEQLGFMRDFRRLCREGAQAGYHERNGGNASYRLTGEDLRAARPFFYDYASSWVPLASSVPAMGDAFVLLTASGCYLKNVADQPAENCAIVQIDPAGAAWRAVWGLKAGGRPTSEMDAHIACHGARRGADDASRALYHAHPASVAALTALVEPDSRVVTNLLWRCLTESVVAFPGGVACLPWMVPGSAALAEATADALATFDACLWQVHGVFAAGDSCDGAFGLVQAIDKAAAVALQVRMAAGDGAPVFRLADGDLRAIAAAYDLPLNESFL